MIDTDRCFFRMALSELMECYQNSRNKEAVATLVLSGRFTGHLPTHYAARWVGRGEMRIVS